MIYDKHSFHFRTGGSFNEPPWSQNQYGTVGSEVGRRDTSRPSEQTARRSNYAADMASRFPNNSQGVITRSGKHYDPDGRITKRITEDGSQEDSDRDPNDRFSKEETQDALLWYNEKADERESRKG